jgi:hypothetical protein
MTTAAEVLAEKAEKNPVSASTLARRLRTRRPSLPPYPQVLALLPSTSVAPWGVDSSRCWAGLGLLARESPRRQVLLFLTKTRLLLRRLLRPLFHRSLRRRTVRGMSLTPVRMSSET